MEIIDKVQNLINNPPPCFEWREIMSDVIRDLGAKPKITLKCSCGKIKTITTNSLLTLHAKSCGCGLAKNPNAKTHGEKGTRLHRIWSNMKTRVLNPKNENYPAYGERGITICDEWLSSFVSFRDWAINNGYQDGLSIDRKNNDLGYCPDNCRWSDNLEQSRNTRSNVFVTIKGKIKCVKDWCTDLGISQSLVCHRVKKRGMTYEQALSTPVRKQTKISKTK